MWKKCECALVSGGRLVESSGPGMVTFALRVDEGALLYEDAGCHFLHVPVPRLAAPRVRAQVAATHDGWHVNVIIEWRSHLICRYDGRMRPLVPAA